MAWAAYQNRTTLGPVGSTTPTIANPRAYSIPQIAPTNYTPGTRSSLQPLSPRISKPAVTVASATTRPSAGPRYSQTAGYAPRVEYATTPKPVASPTVETIIPPRVVASASRNLLATGTERIAAAPKRVSPAKVEYAKRGVASASRNLLAGGNLVSERVVSVEELYARGRFSEAPAERVAASRLSALKTRAQPAVEYVSMAPASARAVEIVGQPGLVEYVQEPQVIEQFTEAPVVEEDVVAVQPEMMMTHLMTHALPPDALPYEEEIVVVPEPPEMMMTHMMTHALPPEVDMGMATINVPDAAMIGSVEIVASGGELMPPSAEEIQAAEAEALARAELEQALEAQRQAEAAVVADPVPSSEAPPVKGLAGRLARAGFTT